MKMDFKLLAFILAISVFNAQAFSVQEAKERLNNVVDISKQELNKVLKNQAIAFEELKQSANQAIVSGKQKIEEAKEWSSCHKQEIAIGALSAALVLASLYIIKLKRDLRISLKGEFLHQDLNLDDASSEDFKIKLLVPIDRFEALEKELEGEKEIIDLMTQGNSIDRSNLEFFYSRAKASKEELIYTQLKAKELVDLLSESNTKSGKLIYIIEKQQTYINNQKLYIHKLKSYLGQKISVVLGFKKALKFIAPKAIKKLLVQNHPEAWKFIESQI